MDKLSKLFEESQKMDSPFISISANHGLNHLILDIFSYLNQNYLAKCRLVCKAFKDIIDTSKQWNKYKLRFCMENKLENKCIDHQGTPPHFENLIALNSQWKSTFEHFLHNETKERLIRFVNCVWKHYRKDVSCCKTPTPMEWLKSDLDLLMDTPFDINELNKGGISIFQLSCAIDGIETVQKAMRFNIDYEVIDKSGRSVIQCTAQNSNHKVLKYLLEFFGEKFLDASDNDGNRLIHSAVQWGSKDNVEFILQKRHAFKIDLSAVLNNGANILHIAVVFRRTDILKQLYECLKQDGSEIDFDTQDIHGNTAISFIYKRSNFETLKVVNELRPDLLVILPFI